MCTNHSKQAGTGKKPLSRYLLFMECQRILKQLHTLASPERAAGMARFGINPQSVLGIRIPALVQISGKTGKNHPLALELWDTGIHEARILATMIDEPEKVTEKQMDTWATDFNSWDLCDQCCNRLFRKTPFVRKKIQQWPEQEEEFVKRAGFVLMAQLAVHEKEEEDGFFVSLLPVMERHADDSRNFVKKSVSWALRQIGKRNLRLREEVRILCRNIQDHPGASARWIARDVIRELGGR